MENLNIPEPFKKAIDYHNDIVKKAENKKFDLENELKRTKNELSLRETKSNEYLTELNYLKQRASVSPTMLFSAFTFLILTFISFCLMLFSYNFYNIGCLTVSILLGISLLLVSLLLR